MHYLCLLHKNEHECGGYSVYYANGCSVFNSSLKQVVCNSVLFLKACTISNTLNTHTHTHTHTHTQGRGAILKSTCDINLIC